MRPVMKVILNIRPMRNCCTTALYGYLNKLIFCVRSTEPRSLAPNIKTKRTSKSGIRCERERLTNTDANGSGSFYTGGTVVRNYCSLFWIWAVPFMMHYRQVFMIG